MSLHYTGSLFGNSLPVQEDETVISQCNTEKMIGIQAELLMQKYGSACLDVKQMCEALNIGQSNVYELLKGSTLPVLVIGRRKVVSVVALATYLVLGKSSQISS